MSFQSSFYHKCRMWRKRTVVEKAVPCAFDMFPIIQILFVLILNDPWISRLISGQHTLFPHRKAGMLFLAQRPFHLAFQTLGPFFCMSVCRILELASINTGFPKHFKTATHFSGFVTCQT